jgi:hypothetical protein
MSNPFERLATAEWWAVVGGGPLVARFGPYNGKEAGEVMKTAVEENLAVTLVANVGKEFSVELAREYTQLHDYVEHKRQSLKTGGNDET